MLASVEAQVRRDVEPALTLAGFAVRLSVGAGAVTATATSREIVPPGPVQLSPKVVPVVSAALLSLPVVAWEPDQPPVAVQAVAPLLLHCNWVVAPRVTLAGEADRVSDGADGDEVTATDAVAPAVPPAPVQVKVKLVPVFSAAVASVPLVALVPVQPPLAVHVVALVEDQVRELLPPAATDAGLVDSATVGAGGGGGGVTVTVTEAVPVPPVPEQFSV